MTNLPCLPFRPPLFRSAALFASLLTLLFAGNLRAGTPLEEKYFSDLTRKPNPYAVFAEEGLPDKGAGATRAPDAQGNCKGNHWAVDEKPNASQSKSMDDNSTYSDSRTLGVVYSVDHQPNTPARTDLELKFEHDSERLSTADKTNLNQLANVLQRPELANARFVIIGHTDASGKASYNLRLSCARSLSVAQYLASRKIDPQRLAPYGFGSSQPLVSGNEREAANRRVEVRRRE